MSIRNILVLVACCYILAQAAQAARVLHIDNTLTDYTLKKQETLKSILTKQGFDLNKWYDEILKVNNLTRDSRLSVGQTILIPSNVVYFTNSTANSELESDLDADFSELNSEFNSEVDASEESDEELANFIDDELNLGQAGLMKSEARFESPYSMMGKNFNHRVHFNVYSFENSMKDGANSSAPYNIGLNYQLIKDMMISSTDTGWQAFGLATTFGMLSDADVTRSAKDASIDNTFKIQAFGNFQMSTFLNVKPFVEFTNQDNIVSLENNEYRARTDRAVWAGFGLNRDFYIQDRMMNLELEMAHTVVSNDLTNFSPRKLSGYRFTLRPEIIIDDNNFFTATAEKSFFPANDLKNTTFGIGIGRFL